MISAYEKKKERKFKDDVIIGFASADAIATRVAYFFTDPKDRRDESVVQMWDVFPELFKEKKEKAQEQQKNVELEKYKANLRAFADQWNRRYKDGTENSI